MSRFKKTLTNTIYFLVFTFLVSCNVIEPIKIEKVEYEDISNTCLKKFQMGTVENLVVDTQEKYDSLVNEKYEKRINADLLSLLDFVKDYYPDLNEVQQKELADSLFLESPFYEWITDCSFTEIDFSKKTLVGAFTSTLLADSMEYLIDFSKNINSKEYLLTVKVLSFGLKWLLYKRYSFWFLIEKVPNDYNVVINTIYQDK